MTNSHWLIWLLFPTFVVASEPVCSVPSNSATSGSNNVLKYLENKLGEPPRNEVWVKRDVYLTGVVLKDAILDLRLPKSSERGLAVSLTERQAYRGLEIVSINPGRATLIDRAGKRYELKSGDSRPVTVMLLGEKRQNSMSDLQAMTYAEYQRRIASIGLELVGHITDWDKLSKYLGLRDSKQLLSVGQQIFQMSLQPSEMTYTLDQKKYGATLDRRKIPMISVTSCSNLPLRKQEWDSEFNSIGYECPLSTPGEFGICCGDQCIVKRNPLEDPQSDGGACGRNIGYDECGHYNPLYRRAFDEQPCIYARGATENLTTGTCWEGQCVECIQHSNPCKTERGEIKDGICHFEERPDGSPCGQAHDVDQVCVGGKPVDFENLFFSDAIKTSPTLQLIAAGSLKKEDIDKVAAAINSISAGANSCTGLSNGNTCTPSGAATPKLPHAFFCFDGHCVRCDRASNQLLNVEPCPKSISWPQTPGRRLSCAEPDICVYE